MELKVLLMEVVEENAALSDEERGNLLGEWRFNYEFPLLIMISEL